MASYDKDMTVVNYKQKKGFYKFVYFGFGSWNISMKFIF